MGYCKNMMCQLCISVCTAHTDSSPGSHRIPQCITHAADGVYFCLGLPPSEDGLNPECCAAVHEYCSLVITDTGCITTLVGDLLSDCSVGSGGSGGDSGACVCYPVQHVEHTCLMRSAVFMVHRCC